MTLALFGYQAGVSPITGYGGTFTRADASTCATYLDASGVVQTVAANVPRYQHYDPANLSLGPLLLLEGSRANLVVRCNELATGWTVAGAGEVMTNAYATKAGVSFSRASVLTAASYCFRAVTLTGDAVKAFSILVCADGANAGALVVGIYDATATAWRCKLTLTIAANGTISGVANTGTLLRTVPMADGVYRFEAVSTACTAANTTRVNAVNNDGTIVSSVLIAGVQVEDAAFPSSYIPTVAAAVTRAADALSFPFLPVPQAMTVLADFVEGGTSLMAGTPDTWHITDAAYSANPALSNFSLGNGKYRTYHNNNAAGTSQSDTVATFAIGDRVELRSVLASDGAVTLGQSKNGATEVVAAAGTAAALAAAWKTPTVIAPNSGTSNQGFLALRSLKIAAGVQTLATMRAFAGLTPTTTTTNALAPVSIEAFMAWAGQPRFTAIDTATATALAATATPNADQQVRVFKVRCSFSVAPAFTPITVQDGDTVLWRGTTNATGRQHYEFDFSRRPLRGSRGNAVSVNVASAGGTVVQTVEFDGDFVRAP